MNVKHITLLTSMLTYLGRQGNEQRALPILLALFHIAANERQGVILQNIVDHYATRQNISSKTAFKRAVDVLTAEGTPEQPGLGFIMVVPPPSGGRGKALMLTPKGHAFLRGELQP